MKKDKDVQKLYDELLDLLDKHQDDDVSVNAISWVNDTFDEIDIGFFDKEPDGDNQEKLAEQWFTLTKEEAISELETRITNFKSALGI